MTFVYGIKIPNKTVVIKITFYYFPGFHVDGLIKIPIVCDDRLVIRS